jgi:cytochrome c553
MSVAGIILAALGASCGVSDSDNGSGARSALPYLDDAAFRRGEMLASLVNRNDGYAQQREAHYATGKDGDWDRLGEWNPRVEPVMTAELDSPLGASSTSLSAEARALPTELVPTSEDDPRLVELGRVAFHRYPVQFAPYLRVALASRAAVRRYGLWTDEQHGNGVGGIVRAQVADGSAALALTCSSCHAAPTGEGLADGVSNSAVDLGRAMVDASQGATAPSVASAFLAWGPGRMDVSTHAGTEPARIADLRPVAWLGYLQQDATVRQNNLTSLAIRIETLATTSLNASVRPPRVVALALAAYVRSMARRLPPESDAASMFPAGKAVFESHCARCHASPALTGRPVSLAAVGTDPTLGLSADRGTGTYRVPSLHGVATRGPLLHDGTIASLEDLFDPRRLTTSFAGRLHGDGPVLGHRFGLDLDAASRSQLLEYLSAL